MLFDVVYLFQHESADSDLEKGSFAYHLQNPLEKLHQWLKKCQRVKEPIACIKKNTVCAYPSG